MIYLVTGVPKSMTSAAVGGLDAGGLQVITDSKRQEQLDQFYNSPDNIVNPRYWEPSGRQLREYDFPRAYDGHALKSLYRALPLLAPHSYRVLVMTRHPEEIRQSYNAMHLPQAIVAERWLDYDFPDGEQQQAEYDKRINVLLEHIDNRPDMELSAVWWAPDFNDAPLGHFTELADKGWPIDPEAAAAYIDPTKRRFVLDNLELGVS
jgi:hypothetical protein